MVTMFGVPFHMPMCISPAFYSDWKLTGIMLLFLSVWVKRCDCRYLFKYLLQERYFK